MVKPKPNFILVFMLFATAAAATGWVHSMPLHVLFDADLDSLPRAIGSLRATDIPITTEIKGALDADRVLSRAYTDASGEQQVNLLVVYRKYGRRGFAHRPEMCYPASGLEIVSKSYTTVPYGGRETQAVKIIAQKEGDRNITVYWFASGRQMEANFVKQQLWMALDRLRTHKYGWAFIRVSSLVTTTDEATMANIRNFVKAASNPLIDVLTGDM